MGADANDPGDATRRAMPAQTDLPFGEAVTELLKAREMSMRALARALDMSSGHLTNVLKGRHQMRTDAMNRVADALGVPHTYFRERRALKVLDVLLDDPEALATTWSNVMEKAEERSEEGERWVQSECRAAAAAKVFWEYQRKEAGTPWEDLDETQRKLFCDLARRALKAADSASHRDSSEPS